MNGVKHVRVAPYHAASNGLAERMVQSWDSKDRAVPGPSREMESQNNPPDIPLAVPLSVCAPSPSQAPSVSPADVHGEMESGQRQAQEEVPAVDKAPPVIKQSSQAACLPTSAIL